MLDHHLAAGINSMCSMLAVTPHGQVQRIRRDKALSQHLVLVQIKTPTHGVQNMNFLRVESIPYWLMGLEISMIAPEKRPLILALQFEAADVLHRYFFGTDASQPDQAAQPARTRGRPRRPTLSAREQFLEALDDTEEAVHRLKKAGGSMDQDWLAREAERDTRIDQIDQRLARIEQRDSWPISASDREPPAGHGALSPLY